MEKRKFVVSERNKEPFLFRNFATENFENKN
jgi:hypothetical protein